LERQYELADRAMTMGWAPRQVVIVDEDLGRSGAESSAREGFQHLVADVGLGKVGIILGIEVSRLAATTPYADIGIRRFVPRPRLCRVGGSLPWWRR
jgi:DNA invertase Pin-like site-specific DNA recombinase